MAGRPSIRAITALTRSTRAGGTSWTSRATAAREMAIGATRVLGTVAQWEEWTGLVFPDSGSYVVPGALVPVEIDRERDEGLYLEPGVWMVHSPPV